VSSNRRVVALTNLLAESNPKLFEGVANVSGDGVLKRGELRGDATVREPSGDQERHLLLQMGKDLWCVPVSVILLRHDDEVQCLLLGCQHVTDGLLLAKGVPFRLGLLEGGHIETRVLLLGALGSW
jgi:hypothetical protein